MAGSLKRLGTAARRASVAAAELPALLLLAAGTAHADGAPDVTFEPFPGGLTIHIRDTSEIDSWCDYHADYYNSNRFFLPANGTHELVIPGVPQFRLWNVDVFCDDHADRSLKYWY